MSGWINKWESNGFAFGDGLGFKKSLLNFMHEAWQHCGFRTHQPKSRLNSNPELCYTHRAMLHSFCFKAVENNKWFRLKQSQE